MIQVKGTVGAKVWKQTRAWCMVGPTCSWNLQGKVLEEAGRVRSKSWRIVDSPLKNGDAVKGLQFSSVQFSSVTQSCPTLCNPMNCSIPGLPVHHQLPEFTRTHVHQVSDAIQPSHPLSSPSPPAPNLPQHQGLFQHET